MLTMRLTIGFPKCADYSNGTLEVTVDQWYCDVYALFIAKRVDPPQNAEFERTQTAFPLGNSSIHSGLFEMDGVEYQMVAGLIVDEQFSSLVGTKNFQTFPPQTRTGESVYKISIERDYLKEVLNDFECRIFISNGPHSLFEEFSKSLNEDIPEGHEFFTTSDPIAWEEAGVVINNYRFQHFGLCEHKLVGWEIISTGNSESLRFQDQPRQDNFISNIMEPMTAALIFLYVVVFVMGVFLFKCHQKLK